MYTWMEQLRILVVYLAGETQDNSCIGETQGVCECETNGECECETPGSRNKGMLAMKYQGSPDLSR